MYKSIVLKISQIGDQEDYYGKLMLINGAVLLLLIFLCITKDFFLSIFSHIFTLLWISLITNNVISLHRRHHTDFIWNLSIHSDSKRFIILINAAFIHSGVFLLFTFIQYLISFQAELHIAIITAVLHYSYAVAVGIFLGTIVKSRLLSPALVISFYFIFFFFLGSSWPRIERFRIFSPSVQLLNMSRLLVTNMVSLSAITAFILICSYYILKTNKQKLLIKYILLMLSFTLIFIGPLCEAGINKKIASQEYQTITSNDIEVSYRGINENIAVQYAAMLMDVNTIWMAKSSVYQPIIKIKIDKYFIAPYLKTRMIPFILENGCLNINIFSDAMINFESPELLYDMFTRILNTTKGLGNSSPSGIQLAELLHRIALSNRYGCEFIDYTTAILNKVR